MNYLIVALGSALGGMARYWVTGLQLPWALSGFPTGTLLVNIVGCFIIGVVVVIVSQWGRPSAEPIQLFFMVGLLGGFTTFSSFSLQTISLIQLGQIWLALWYVALSVLCCIGAAFAGYWVAHTLSSA